MEELAYQIKKRLLSTRKSSPLVSIEVPLDLTTFQSELTSCGSKLGRSVRGQPVYGILQHSDLNAAFGEDWHIRLLNTGVLSQMCSLHVFIPLSIVFCHRYVYALMLSDMSELSILSGHHSLNCMYLTVMILLLHNCSFFLCELRWGLLLLPQGECGILHPSSQGHCGSGKGRQGD